MCIALCSPQARHTFKRCSSRPCVTAGRMQHASRSPTCPARASALLAHLYRGECHVTSSSLPGTLAAASRLEVASLLRAGAEFLERELTPANAIVTWLLAAELGRPIEFCDLITACQRTVSESFEEATQCDAFPRLRSEHMAALLAPTNPVDSTELDLFRAVARWAKGQSPP